MLYVFIIIKKFVYTCKKRNFNACARCSDDLVITKNRRQHAIAAFRRYSVYDDFFFSLKNTFIHIKNAILKCALVVRTILSLLRMDASMPLRLSAVIQSRMICFFFLSEKHVYACKKHDFNTGARWSYDLVITKNQLQHAIAAFRRYSVYDDMFFFSLKNMFMHVKNAILTRALVVRRVMSPLSISANEKIAFFLIFYNILICCWKCILYVK